MMMLKPLLIGAFEAALNRYLTLDPDIGLLLSPLSGKVIKLVITPFNSTVYACPGTSMVQWMDDFAGEPDATLTGSGVALGLLSFKFAPLRSLYANQISITGDIETGRRFKELFDKLNINLQTPLSQIAGEAVAHNVSSFMQAGYRWHEDTLSTFKMNIREFLQDETRDLPSKPETDVFFRRIESLTGDYDQLLNKIKLLEEKQKQTG
ncbi:SCP2 sterol-binding domain-containing protein [Methylicorpusculum oleiharenae]|uniref:ubiquinone biosynthesis accessory factor UbiJ n=1 Tax=Methylicorpusculum oleiharenae TaxID=1338687 RepID=UPI00135BD32B|nr:SCP2 sterol-binding domain-containing protein [Methylicorpusculum oleiharenae]MCD2449165.1 SCP2 sterol-binding domain-containing protein [Methylicorpusculum oleiharenae]